MPRSILRLSFLLIRTSLVNPYEEGKSDLKRAIQGRLMLPNDWSCSPTIMPQVGELIPELNAGEVAG